HAGPAALPGSNQSCEIGRRAEAAGRRVHTGRLVASGAIERMLVDRLEFDMGNAEIAGVGRKLLGKLTIVQPLIVALAPPRAEMNLIDRHWRAQRVDVRGRWPRMRNSGLVEHDRSRLGTDFLGKGH